MHAQIQLLWLKVVKHQARDLGGEDFGQNDADTQHQRHYGDDHGKSLLRVLLPFFCQKARVDRNESDRDRAACDQVSQEIGNLEGGDISIRRRTSPKCPRSIGFANIADDA